MQHEISETTHRIVNNDGQVGTWFPRELAAFAAFNGQRYVAFGNNEINDDDIPEYWAPEGKVFKIVE